MKIKQSRSFDNKAMTVIFFAASLVAAVLRIYQLTRMIDAATGFFEEKNAVIYVFYAILALAGVVIAISSYLNGDVTPNSFPENKSIPIGIISVFCAISLFFDSAFSLLSSFAASADELAGTFRTLMKTGALPLFVQSIIAVFAAVYFIILASSYFRGNVKFRKHKILALMPVGWCVVRMIRRFVRQISFINVSDLLLELIMIALLLLFFMAFAQMASGVYDEGTRWRLAGFGLPAAMFCIVTALPRLIFVILGQSAAYINEYHPLYPCDLALAVFIIAVVFSKAGAPERVQEQPELEQAQGE